MEEEYMVKACYTAAEQTIMVNRSLYDQHRVVFWLRLALGATVLAVGLLAKVILRRWRAEFPISFGGAVLLLISYGLLAWPPLRQRTLAWALPLGNKWRALPGGWRFVAAGIVLAVFLGVNAHYLLHLPFVLESYTYQQTTDGRFVRVGTTGFSRDTVVQLTGTW